MQFVGRDFTETTLWSVDTSTTGGGGTSFVMGVTLSNAGDVTVPSSGYYMVAVNARIKGASADLQRVIIAVNNRVQGDQVRPLCLNGDVCFPFLLVAHCVPRCMLCHSVLSFND